MHPYTMLPASAYLQRDTPGVSHCVGCNAAAMAMLPVLVRPGPNHIRLYLRLQGPELLQLQLL